MNLYSFMLVYQDVLSPIYFLLLCAIIVVYLDWKEKGGSMMARVATIVASWVVAYAIYSLYFYLYPGSPQWVEDAFAVAGLMTAAAITYLVWSVKGYGRTTVGAIVSSMVVSIPYVVISPVWNISGHVAFTTAPAAFLTAIDRKFAPLFVVPIIMLVNRPIVGAHTVAESVAGLLLGLLSLVGVWYIRREVTPCPATTRR